MSQTNGTAEAREAPRTVGVGEPGETPPSLPPVVYVPAQSTQPDGDQMTREMRRLADRRVALLLYTALDRLVAACGEAQPWALLRTDQLASLREEGDWDVVLVDAELPADLRRGADEALGDEDGQDGNRQGEEGLGDA